MIKLSIEKLYWFVRLISSDGIFEIMFDNEKEAMDTYTKAKKKDGPVFGCVSVNGRWTVDPSAFFIVQITNTADEAELATYRKLNETKNEVTFRDTATRLWPRVANQNQGGKGRPN